MDEPQSFQEKPDWKGKLKGALQKTREDLTGFIRRKKRTDIGSPLSPSSPYIPDPTNQYTAQQDRTLTGLIKMHWRNRVQPKFSFGGGGSGGGKGGESSSFDPRQLGFLATLLAIVLVAWVAADLAAFYAEKMIPEPPPARYAGAGSMNVGLKPLSDYQIIIDRNLFSSLGRIPGDEAPGIQDQNNEPVKTSLPLNLIGTLILKDPTRSVATLEDKSESQVYPVRVDDEIPGKIKILSIEAYKVVFRNLGNGQREYIDLPEDGNAPSIAVGTLSSRRPTKGSEGIEQSAPDTFNISRTEVDRAMSNMQEILTQARAIPHFENGQPAGYKLIQIVPGSIYEKLGLKNGDIICGANDESINDPARALELMNQLRTASSIRLCVKRGGRVSNNTYNFR